MTTPASSVERRLSALGRSARQADYDRYLIALFAPPDKREVLFALLGFNHELARIRESVTEPILGQIRFQWWREAAAEALAGRPRRHDVLEGLSMAGVPPALIEEILEAREAELAPEPPQTLDDYRAHACGTSGALSEAIAVILGGTAAARAGARGIGTAFGMVGILRATRFLAGCGRVLLPSRLLDEAGTSVAAVKELRADPGLARAVEWIAQAAQEELDAVRASRVRVPKGARAPLLLTPLTDAYLARLRAMKFDILNGDLSLTPLRKQLAVGWAAARGKI